MSIDLTPMQRVALEALPSDGQWIGSVPLTRDLRSSRSVLLELRDLLPGCIESQSYYRGGKRQAQLFRLTRKGIEAKAALLGVAKEGE